MQPDAESVEDGDKFDFADLDAFASL